MPEREIKQLQMLLVEPETLLRRTVSLTARSLGLGQIHEACSIAAAQRMLQEQAFSGAVISIDCASGERAAYDLSLLDQVRNGLSASPSTIPIAVMAECATAELLRNLRGRDIERVILKPFRAKTLLDTFAAFEAEKK